MYEEEDVSEAITKGMLPAAQTLKYAVEQVARRAGREVGFSLSFQVAAGGPGPVAVEFHCPKEFGDACDLLIEPVLAFGGSCTESTSGTTCTLPDS